MTEFVNEGDKFYDEIKDEFQSIETALSNWQMICESSQSCIVRVVALTKQRKICVKMDASKFRVPFSPEQREILQSLIELELEDELRKLNDHLNELEAELTKVRTESHRIMKLYRSRVTIIQGEQLIEATCNSPSVAKFLEYIADIEWLLKEEYDCRQIALMKFDMTSSKTLQEYWKKWNVKNTDLQDFRNFFCCTVYRNTCVHAWILLTVTKMPNKLIPIERLNGVPGKCQDHCVEFDFCIKKWNALNQDGLVLIEEIGAEVLENRNNTRITNETVCERCGQLTAIYDKMVSLAEKMGVLVSQFAALAQLQKNPDASDPFAATCYENGNYVFKCFIDECKTKEITISNIPDVTNHDQHAYLKLMWAYQPLIKRDVKMKVESMLVVSGVK
ncbi:hypothetical protein CHUAL_013928 [Chamberlinius hualienensis]